MKDIELAKEYLEKKGLSGFAHHTDVPKWMVDFAQQYHQSQLSKLPSDEEIQQHIEKNTRHPDNTPAMDEQCFYEGAKWMRDKANNL